MPSRMRGSTRRPGLIAGPGGPGAAGPGAAGANAAGPGAAGPGAARAGNPRPTGGLGGRREPGPVPRGGQGDRSEIARIVIDGRNAQRAMERGSAMGSMPTATLIARLRAAFSPPTEVELVLDGHPGGSPQGRVAPGLRVTFSRGATADAVIIERAAETLRDLGPVGAWSVVVVTDDREVRDGARRSGVRVEGTAWLSDRMAGGGQRGPGGPGSSGRVVRGSTIGNRPRR